jgi:hypothetical protein
MASMKELPMRIGTLALLAIVYPSLLFAAQGPTPADQEERTTSKPAVRDEVSIPTDNKATTAEPGKAEPKKAIGVSPAVKAKLQAKKKAMAAGAARGRAEFQAALQQRQTIAQQNAILQKNQMLEQQQLQQQQKQQMIRRMMPQGETVVTVNPDGTYNTKTYYFYPTPIYPPGVNPPVAQPNPPTILPYPLP